MSSDVIDALGDARRATTTLLLPFDAGTWLRLAIVAFFVGSAGSVGQIGGNVAGGPGDGGGPGPGGMPSLPDAEVLAIAAVVAVVVALVVLSFALIGAVMEFVLVDALRTGTVRIREPFRERFGAGARLFAVRVLLWGLVFGVALVPAAVLFVLGGEFVFGSALLVLVPLYALAALLVFFAAVLVELLLRDLVVPTMIAEDRGVVSGLRRVAGVVAAEPVDVLLFYVVRTVLLFVVSLVVGLVLAVVVGLVSIPVVILGVIVLVVAESVGIGAVSFVGIALFAVLLAVLGAVVLVVSAVLNVPVVTFFRYYALFVLGTLDADLDLVDQFREDDSAS